LRFSIPNAIVDFLFKVQDKMGMTHNARGLLLCWQFITVSRQLKPTEITDDQVNNKCSKEFRPPDTS
jgi:hypothetical protein